LEDIGLEGRRLQMINVSAAMASEFAASAAEISEEIHQLGPNPLRSNRVRTQTAQDLQQASEILDTEVGTKDG
jgi:hypothetical protein